MADNAQKLLLVKQRLDMMPGITARDDYLEMRIKAAEGELAKMGIALDDSPEDLLLLVDYTVWSFQNRDKPGTRPDWLTAKIRERWLKRDPE